MYCYGFEVGALEFMCPWSRAVNGGVVVVM